MAIETLGIEQIEKDMARLPAEELARRMHGLEDAHARVREERSDRDPEAGRLDPPAAGAEGEDRYFWCYRYNVP